MRKEKRVKLLLHSIKYFKNIKNFVLYFLALSLKSNKIISTLKKNTIVYFLALFCFSLNLTCLPILFPIDVNIFQPIHIYTNRMDKTWGHTDTHTHTHTHHAYTHKTHRQSYTLKSFLYKQQLSEKST